jgi:hypothetical protein
MLLFVPVSKHVNCSVLGCWDGNDTSIWTVTDKSRGFMPLSPQPTHSSIHRNSSSSMYRRTKRRITTTPRSIQKNMRFTTAEIESNNNANPSPLSPPLLEWWSSRKICSLFPVFGDLPMYVGTQCQLTQEPLSQDVQNQRFQASTPPSKNLKEVDHYERWQPLLSRVGIEDHDDIGKRTPDKTTTKQFPPDCRSTVRFVGGPMFRGLIVGLAATERNLACTRFVKLPPPLLSRFHRLDTTTATTASVVSCASPLMYLCAHEPSCLGLIMEMVGFYALSPVDVSKDADDVGDTKKSNVKGCGLEGQQINWLGSTCRTMWVQFVKAYNTRHIRVIQARWKAVKRILGQRRRQVVTFSSRRLIRAMLEKGVMVWIDSITYREMSCGYVK